MEIELELEKGLAGKGGREIEGHIKASILLCYWLFWFDILLITCAMLLFHLFLPFLFCGISEQSQGRSNSADG